MNIPFHRALIAAALVAALAAPALAAPDDRAMAPSGRDQQGLYWQGHEQLKAGRWDEAIARFSELEQDLRRSEPASADAAMYWRAYAQAKAKRLGEARATLDRLRREFPQSRWLGEVQRLQDELGSAPARSGGEEVALVDAAIEGLLAAPPERALPLLKRVVEGNYATRSKKRALFVLSQIDDPQASTLVMQVAREGEGALRREAINMLGIGGDLASLQALYSGSSEREVRKAVLDAYLIAGHKAGLLAVAQDAAAADLRRDAVHLLGAAGAGEELRLLLDKERDEGLLDAVVDALGISGNAAVLAGLARDAQRPLPLRRKALQALGIAGAEQELPALYRELADPALKDAALDGLMISGNGAALRELYRQAGDDEEKRRILRVLTLVGDEGALDAIEAAIEQGERQ